MTRRARAAAGGAVAVATVGVLAAGVSGASFGAASVAEAVRSSPAELAAPLSVRRAEAGAPDGDVLVAPPGGDGPTTTSAAPTTTTPPPTTTTAPPPPPTPTALPPAPPPVPDPATLPALSRGDRGETVALLQDRLDELGFRTADERGYFGRHTWSAVLALQKFEGLGRTGAMDADSWVRLYSPTGWMPPSRPATGIEVEVDVERQVVIVLNAERPGQVTILNTSTGGEYTYYNKDGSRDYAWTPPGRYEGYRRYDGVEVAPLGTLYRPIYFYRGWAVHGSPSVPARPVSHGCVRLSYDDMDWLWDRAPDDLKVTVRSSMNPPLLAAEEAEWAAEAAKEAAEARAAAQREALAAFKEGVDASRAAVGLPPFFSNAS